MDVLNQRHLHTQFHKPIAQSVCLGLRPGQQLVCKAQKAEQQAKHLDRDAEKEAARKYRRPVFGHPEWAAHRSTNRYFRHTKGLLTSRIVRGLVGPLLYVGLISLAVSTYELMLNNGTLAEWGYNGLPKIALEITGPFSLSTFALSLLLVFRTNSSYHRWNEARKIWGSIINRSRDIARQAAMWLAAEPELSRALCRWTVAFPVVLMASVREDVELVPALKQVLLPEELQLVQQQPHPGTAVLQAMGMCIRASAAKDIEKLRMDESVSALQDMMGGCERIFKTPIPLSYTRHTSRFLVCWLTLLPFCVADSVGWATVPIACGMAFFLFGTEEIGVQIEEPFGILPLESFCDTIAKNVAQAQAAADMMRRTAELHAAAAAEAVPVQLQAVPVQLQAVAVAAGTAAEPNGSSTNSSVERVSGGYTLPRPPPAVSNVIAEQENIFADKLSYHSGDDSDSSF